MDYKLEAHVTVNICKYACVYLYVSYSKPILVSEMLRITLCVIVIKFIFMKSGAAIYGTPCSQYSAILGCMDINYVCVIIIITK